jgi:hypothetical protein
MGECDSMASARQPTHAGRQTQRRQRPTHGEDDEGLPLSTLPAVTWDPTEHKIEEKLIALAYLLG